MRRSVVLSILLLSAPVAASADDALACRLTRAECAIVLYEVAIDAELFAQDQEIVGLGLPPQDRAKALIRRDEDRMAARLQQLPAPIAVEIARIRACQAFRGMETGTPPDQICP